MVRCLDRFRGVVAHHLREMGYGFLELDGQCGRADAQLIDQDMSNHHAL